MGFLRDAFSENGTPSSTRLLMGVFSLFTIGILWKIFSHLLKLSGERNATILATWLSNLPLIITALCGLIAAPYAVNRGTGAISDLATFVSKLKKGD